MTRHPTARRVHQSSTPDDRLLQLVLWSKAHLRALIAGAAAVLVIALAVNYSIKMRGARQVEAALRLEEVRQTVLSGNGALAIRDLEEFIDRFSGTRAADEARLLLARSALAEGETTKAIEAVTPLAQALDQDLGPSAAFLLGAAYEQQGNAAEAVKIYLQVADQASHAYQRRAALQHAARVYEEEGDHASAVETYQRFLEATAENTPERALAELRLAEAEARASAAR